MVTAPSFSACRTKRGAWACNSEIVTVEFMKIYVSWTGAILKKVRAGGKPPNPVFPGGSNFAFTPFAESWQPMEALARIPIQVNPITPLNLPREAPVMVLPNAVMVPNALLPLHIFEPQYREMLSWSLERDRLFCVALLMSPATEAGNFFSVGGIGLVRACVEAGDGSSNLILQGLARVKFGNLLQEQPFRIAEIRHFPSDCANLVEAEALGAKVVEICGKLHEQGRKLPGTLLQKLRHVTNPELLADIVTQTFVRDPVDQQRLLEEASVSERMRVLIRYLQAEGAGA